MKLVIPLLLALALLPISALAEEGADTTKGGNATTSTLDNPGVGRVITDEGIIDAKDDPDLPEWAKKNNKKRESEKDKDPQKHYDENPGIVSGVGQSLGGVSDGKSFSSSPNGTIQKDRYEYRSRVQFTKSETLPEENNVILPPIDKEKFFKLHGERGIGKIRELPVKTLPWRYIENRKEEGGAYSVWQAAIVSQGAFRVSLYFNSRQLPPGAELFTYDLRDQSSPQEERFPYRETGRGTGGGGNFIGDTIFFEMHWPASDSSFPGNQGFEIDDIVHWFDPSQI